LLSETFNNSKTSYCDCLKCRCCDLGFRRRYLRQTSQESGGLGGTVDSWTSRTSSSLRVSIRWAHLFLERDTFAKETKGQRDKDANRQTDNQTIRQSDKQTNRQRVKLGRKKGLPQNTWKFMCFRKYKLSSSRRNTVKIFEQKKPKMYSIFFLF
jgi:hypothetical protein